MTTLLEFRTSLRNMLTDKTQWRDTLLTSWVQDAIRDYSLNFPRLVRTTLAMATGTKAYVLSSYTIITMRAVEYPTSQTPRRLLDPLERSDSLFDGNPYYDLSSDRLFIYMGESPTTGQSMLIEYDSIHAIPTSDSVELTVPTHHSELLRLYVIWKACVSLEMDENVSIARKREMMNALGLNAYRAERAYRGRLREALAASPGSGPTGPWVMDRKDRIY